MKRLSIFLITVALIAGMVGCGCVPFVDRLTITSTEGGSVTDPGEGTFSYFSVQCCPSQKLVAEADEGYRFVEWTGDGCLPDYADAAITWIMIPTYDCSITAHFWPECSPMIAAGGLHTLGLKDNGRVFALGDNSYGQCNVGDWRGVTQVAAGYKHTIGLKSDGTVVAAGPYHTVGLKSDGHVVAVGDNYHWQCDVSSWTNIIHVAAGDSQTVGLKKDGTVVATAIATNVSRWTDIVQVSVRSGHTVGLKSDGTVVAVGSNRDGQCNVGGGWMLIS